MTAIHRLKIRTGAAFAWRPLGVLLCVTWAFVAVAQPLNLWVWKDAHGTMVYSDRAPPAHIRPAQIVQHPSSASDDAAARQQPAKTAQAGFSPRESVRRENCHAAQASLGELRRRKHWLVEAADGTTHAMDEGMRRAETARLRQIMRDNCTYAP